MARYVALLRGVNLGSQRRVPMADLRAHLEELGYEDVRTLLQSGNVGLTSAKAAAVRALEGADVAPEVSAVAGQEIHVWHAGGIQRSPASKVLERADLGAIGTARNWNTVEKLLDLA